MQADRHQNVCSSREQLQLAEKNHDVYQLYFLWLLAKAREVYVPLCVSQAYGAKFWWQDQKTQRSQKSQRSHSFGG